MSSTISPADALSGIPGWDGSAVVITELKGGLTNRIYRVERNGQQCILRLDTEHTDSYGLDRRLELSVLKQAADKGLAAKVIFSDVAAGILLRTFIPGRTWEVSDLDDTANIAALSVLLHEVHALPNCGTVYDASGVARRYVENLRSNDSLHAFGVRCQEIIDSIEGSGVTCCCHNDMVVDNIISGSHLVLIDWEYACDNEPLFDLASLIAYHDLNEDKSHELLSAYSGGADPNTRELLGEQVRLYDAIQWLWFANRQMITHESGQVARLEKLQQRIR